MALNALFTNVKREQYAPFWLSFFSPSIFLFFSSELSFDLLWQSESFRVCDSDSAKSFEGTNISIILAEKQGSNKHPTIYVVSSCLFLYLYRNMWQYILRGHLNIDTARLFSSCMEMKNFSEELFDLAVNLGHKEYSQSRLCSFYYYCRAKSVKPETLIMRVWHSVHAWMLYPLCNYQGNWSVLWISTALSLYVQ